MEFRDVTASVCHSQGHTDNNPNDNPTGRKNVLRSQRLGFDGLIEASPLALRRLPNLLASLR
jgi:hypothetical protein